MRNLFSVTCFLLVSACLSAAELYEHCMYEAVSLDGAWEMAYQPYAWVRVEMPEFRGVTIGSAVPGYLPTADAYETGSPIFAPGVADVLTAVAVAEFTTGQKDK